MIRALLVDDEPIARRGLRALLAPHPDVVIAGECRSGVEARAAIGALAPDLVFLDVQMPDLDGFGVLDGGGPARPAVIFVTAFEQFARRAFDVEAVDYLLKPFERSRFEQALARARARLARGTERVILRDGRHTEIVDPARVTLVEARGNYVRLHLDGRRILHRGTLAGIARRLGSRRFQPVSRSILVNLGRVTRAAPLANGRYRLELEGAAPIETSRRQTPRFLAAWRAFDPPAG